MQVENKELIESIIRNISKDHKITELADLDKLSRNELITKVLVSEATVKVLNEKIRILEWENHIWNSSDELKVPKV